MHLFQPADLCAFILLHRRSVNSVQSHYRSTCSCRRKDNPLLAHQVYYYQPVYLPHQHCHSISLPLHQKLKMHYISAFTLSAPSLRFIPTTSYPKNTCKPKKTTSVRQHHRITPTKMNTPHAQSTSTPSELQVSERTSGSREELPPVMINGLPGGMASEALNSAISRGLK